jgi:hypothetical protein
VFALDNGRRKMKSPKRGERKFLESGSENENRRHAETKELFGKI